MVMIRYSVVLTPTKTLSKTPNLQQIVFTVQVMVRQSIVKLRSLYLTKLTIQAVSFVLKMAVLLTAHRRLQTQYVFKQLIAIQEIQ